ncbi:MAG: NUDIX domain-containing protein [Pseudomonadota bacterium]
MSVEIKAHAVAVHVLRRVGEVWQVLILYRTSATIGWSQVAGGIEAGEKAWQAGLRELREEASLVPETYYSADFCEQFYDYENDCICIFPVFVAMVAAHAQVVLNDEHSAFRWASFEEADALLPYPGQRRAIAMIRDAFVLRSPDPLLRIEGWR